MQKGRPSYAYGVKLMKQMGWREGKGLGRNEDGNADFIKVKKKLNTKGIGFNGVDDRWVEHQEAFDSLLSQLNDGDPAAVEDKLIGVEERAFKLGGRVHYSKFLRGKDLSQKKQEELNAIVIKRKKKDDESRVPEVEIKEEKGDLSGVKTHTSSLSYQEYFTQRMEALRRRKGSSENKEWEPSRHTGSNVHVSEEEVTEAASQKVGRPDACTHVSSSDDQECSRQGTKKTRQSAIRSTFEKSTPECTMVANGHVDEATALATEEPESAPRKPRKSKRKSPESLALCEGTESAPQKVVPLDTHIQISSLDDQECSKQSRRRKRQRSIETTFEEFAQEGVTEELNGAPRKSKKSKWKSPDKLTFSESAEAASQEVLSLGTCKRFHLDDQECSKQGMKKTRQRSLQSTFEESTPRGTLVAASGHVGEAAILATEEVDSAPRKLKKSKRKSPDSLSGTDGETERFEETSIKKKQKPCREDPVNGIRFVRSATVMSEQSGEAAASVSEELECIAQQPPKKKLKKASCDYLAETDSLQVGTVERKVKSKRTPEDTNKTSIEVKKETRSTDQHLGKSATFQECESAALQPKKSKRESGDDQAGKNGPEEKAGKIKLNRSNAEKVDAMASEACLEYCALEKSKLKKKKVKERTERTTLESQQVETGSEDKAKTEPKQKRKAAASVSDEQLIERGGKKMKLKRKERTELEESGQEGQPVECTPEATQPEVLPGNCKSTTKHLESAGSEEVVPNRKLPRKKTKGGTGQQTFTTSVALKPWEQERQRWQIGHSFRNPYKMPPVSYETAAAMACWVVNTVEQTATRITPNKVCHLSKDEYAELLGNHIYKRHRTSNWMQIPGYASKLWLARCIPQLVSSLRKKAQLEKDAEFPSGERTAAEEESSKKHSNAGSVCR